MTKNNLKKVDAETQAAFGLSEASMICVQAPSVFMSDSLVDPWQHLHAAAKQAGFSLKIASGFRSFERQLLIWNQKMRGERTLLDDCGKPILSKSLSQLEKIHAVMRWSALPGASRHHWGSDIDVYDESSIVEGYQLQLVTEEYTDNGPFSKMACWLQAFVKEEGENGFFFPYRDDNGGIAPEPWHLSYSPIANEIMKHWDQQTYLTLIEQTEIEGKAIILEHFDELYQRYIAPSLHAVPDFSGSRSRDD